jgi:RNA polymerase sigma-70 factor (ECF subfamily)
MVDNGRALLRQMLLAGYDELKLRLTRHAGSADAATEVLHDAWIRLGQMPDGVTVEKPRSYLYRMALNIIADRHRADVRWVSRAELEGLLRSEDDQLDPEYIVAMKSEMAALERVVAALPMRRREIFNAALIEHLTYRQIAKRFGISLRSVEREMRDAFDQCSEQLEQFSARRRSGGSGNVLDIEMLRNRVADANHDD